MQDTMHIVFSTDANYARYMGVTLLSIMKNRNPGDDLAFHILDGGITESDRSKITRMAKEDDCTVDFIPMDDSMLASLPITMGGHHVTIATYYRLFLPVLLFVPRCIYLDCDMIVRGSLRPLWQTDLHGHIMAGVEDISAARNCARLSLDTYVNAGALVMDLDAMRREHVFDRFMDFMRSHPEKLEYHDQDVMNSVLQGRLMTMSKQWNCMLCKTRSCREAGFYALRDSAPVIHFVGHRKPWHKRCKTPMRMLYWQYLQRSPWAEPKATHLWHMIRSFFRL